MKRRLRQRCKRVLTAVFGLDAYRPGQYGAVKALLAGRDVLCILPTGAGKSLCWQLPAVVHPGLTVVISPLIALMRDQVRRLAERGIPAETLDSLLSPGERAEAMARLRRGTSWIVFVSPERLQQREFRDLCRECPPWLVVADEAHCIVQWGEHFRPAYGQIADFLRSLPVRPVLCAMTATADAAMQRDIVRSLTMRRTKRVVLSVLRENLTYTLRTTLDATAEILRLCGEKPCKTVVFCRARARTEQLCALLTARGVSAAFYHAGMARETRMQVQQRFIGGEIEVLCATTAFGMGVDVPDIRRIIHDELPDSVTDCVQQCGRAGRDGAPADCILLLEPRRVAFAVMMARSCSHARGEGHLHPWLRSLSRRRKLHALLRTLLTDRCIPAGLSAAFGQRVKPCGKCSACRDGAPLRRLPHLGSMHQQEVYAFFLTWQRDALAKRRGCKPRQLMPDALLLRAASDLTLPPGTDVPEELQRLIRHFRE